jgi:hypothetical protein
VGGAGVATVGLAVGGTDTVGDADCPLPGPDEGAGADGSEVVVGAGLPLAVGVTEGDADGDADGVADGVGRTLTVGVADGDGVTVGVGVGSGR